MPCMVSALISSSCFIFLALSEGAGLGFALAGLLALSAICDCGVLALTCCCLAGSSLKEMRGDCTECSGAGRGDDVSALGTLGLLCAAACEAVAGNGARSRSLWEDGGVPCAEFSAWLDSGAVGRVTWLDSGALGRVTRSGERLCGDSTASTSASLSSASSSTSNSAESFVIHVGATCTFLAQKRLSSVSLLPVRLSMTPVTEVGPFGQRLQPLTSQRLFVSSLSKFSKHHITSLITAGLR